MSTEFLQSVWFFLIAALWIGFFFLEGFDFGVGMLLPFLGGMMRNAGRSSTRSVPSGMPTRSGS